jgi:hypothetical protein
MTNHKDLEAVRAALDLAVSTSYSETNCVKFATALSILDRMTAEAGEPVEYQMLILGNRWAHCAKHIYDNATDRSIVRALYLYPSPDEPVKESLTHEPLIYGYATHHDEPMLFPTREEAALHCDDDEEPIALVAHGIGEKK